VLVYLNNLTIQTRRNRSIFTIANKGIKYIKKRICLQSIWVFQVRPIRGQQSKIEIHVPVKKNSDIFCPEQPTEEPCCCCWSVSVWIWDQCIVMVSTNDLSLPHILYGYSNQLGLFAYTWFVSLRKDLFR